MHPINPFDILFGGMDKLGPGDDGETLRVLGTLPRQDFDVIVDAGCGTGRQSLVLAAALGRTIHALDISETFLEELRARAAARGLEAFIDARCLDMTDIPAVFPRIDLLWSEGAAYSIGFAHALRTWRPAIARDGFVVASELCWTGKDVPPDVADFFGVEYPDMMTIPELRSTVECAGYRILGMHVLPASSWTVGFYDDLLPRSTALCSHPDENVRSLAASMLREIEVFRMSAGSYTYAFLVLQPD